MNGIIEPRVLKGFRDFLPDKEARRLATIRTLEGIFSSFGFLPIDTPVLEYTEVLLGKGGGETDKQVYRFTDNGGRDVAMRYDLTVPFARFMAAHLPELTLPFRRYHAAKVWRGENTQRGRYREFIQVDFDVVGTDAPSADLEILLLMARCMEALKIPDCRIHFSHRGVFNSFLTGIGVGEKAADVLRTVDKLAKVGAEETGKTLSELCGPDGARRVLSFITAKGTMREVADRMAADVPPDCSGIIRLREVVSRLEELGLSARYVLDPSITRGLDYYTGIVFETFLTQLPQIGSVCSGGRYDDLASLYTKERLPGVGASIGLDRLMAALEELGVGATEGRGPSVLVLFMDESLLGHYHALAETVRAAGIPAEVYPEKRKLQAQFSYAEKAGIPYALICGEAEKARGVVSLKDLGTRRSWDDLSPDALRGKLKELHG